MELQVSLLSLWAAVASIEFLGAVKDTDYMRLTPLLMTEGVDVFARYIDDGDTVLMHAVKNQPPIMTKLLLEHKYGRFLAKLRESDVKTSCLHRTPLHWAIESASLFDRKSKEGNEIRKSRLWETIRIMATSEHLGGALLVQDEFGQTPFMYMASIDQSLEAADVTRMLLNKPEASEALKLQEVFAHKTALIIAADSTEPGSSLVELLADFLGKDPIVCHKDIARKTALHYAFGTGNKERVVPLIRNKASCPAYGAKAGYEQETTLLHTAVDRGDVDMLKLLLERAEITDSMPRTRVTPFFGSYDMTASEYAKYMAEVGGSAKEAEIARLLEALPNGAVEQSKIDHWLFLDDLI